MDYQNFDDPNLIQLIAQANTDALSALYDRYCRLVFSLAFHMTGDRETAEDLTQEVFLLVWENAHTYQASRAKVNTWLTSITRNRTIDALRRQQVRPEGHSIGFPDFLENTLPAENNPEKAAEQAIEKNRVRQAVAQLPPPQKQALGLAYFGGYTQQEIAKMLDEPLGTIKTRIRLGMIKLRELLFET